MSIYYEKNWKALLFNWKDFRNFALPAFFFGLSQAINLASGASFSAASRKTVGQLKLPLAAFFTKFVFGKEYTGYQWLGLMLITASVFSYLGLKKMGFVFGAGSNDDTLEGLILVLLGALASVFGSLFAEKLTKGGTSPFYVQKVHIEFWQLIPGVFQYMIGGWLIKYLAPSSFRCVSLLYLLVCISQYFRLQFSSRIFFHTLKHQLPLLIACLHI